MDLLKSIPNPFKTQTTGTDAGAANAGEGKSLLADWTAYSASTRDVESGQQTAAAGPTTEVLYQRLGSAAENMSGFFKNSFTRVQTAATTVSQNLPTAETFSIPSTQQLVYFFSFLAGGLVFLTLAFMLFLPTIMFSPSKFAMSFTLGCLLIMIGFFQLRGWKQVQHMLSRERLPFTAAYLGSIVMTLYAALIMHSYLLSLLASGFQVVALVYYVMSYFPGGAQGAKIMLGLFGKAITNCFTGVTRMVLR